MPSFQKSLDDNALRRHPLAVWIELEIGLEDGQRLSRRKPITIADAAERLAELGLSALAVITASVRLDCAETICRESASPQLAEFGGARRRVAFVPITDYCTAP